MGPENYSDPQSPRDQCKIAEVDPPVSGQSKITVDDETYDDLYKKGCLEENFLFMIAVALFALLAVCRQVDRPLRTIRTHS
jgi:hypothetical protein